MTFPQLITSRYSVRSFSDKKVEDEKINQLLQAAMVAPTAKNNQPQRLYVVKSEQAIEKLNSVCRCVFGAKTAIIFTFNKSEAWKSPFSDDYHAGEIDCAIACTHVMLQAWELGIGSCWVGYFDPEQVRKTLGISEEEQVVAILPIGYPAEDSVPNPRHSVFKPMEEMVKYL